MDVYNVYLEQQTIARLKRFAEPLVDTVDSVVNKAVDALEKSSSGAPGAMPGRVKTFASSAPPNLAHTVVRSIILNGKIFPKTETYWNSLMIAAIREAKKDRPTEEVAAMITVNNVIGKKEDSGYKFLEDVGLSVQGQDANAAWKAAYNILKKIKASATVAFEWQDHPKAAAPGEQAQFVVEWN